MSFKDHVSHARSGCRRSGLKRLRRCLLPRHRSTNAVLLNTAQACGAATRGIWALDGLCHKSNQFATETLTS